VLSESRTALFSVTNRNKNVFMLVEIFKVLQGETELSVDPYAKIKVCSKSTIPQTANPLSFHVRNPRP